MVFHEVNVSESDLKKNLEVPEAPNGNFVKQKKIVSNSEHIVHLLERKKNLPT